MKRYIQLFVIIAILGTMGGYFLMTHGGKKAREFTGNFQPKITEIENGHYKGTYHILGFVPGAKVSFNVQDQYLINFTIHQLFSTPGNDVKSKILNQVENTKSLNFDVIEDAVYSSYFVKAAIKDAVRGDDNPAGKKKKHKEEGGFQPLK